MTTQFVVTIVYRQILAHYLHIFKCPLKYMLLLKSWVIPVLILFNLVTAPYGGVY